MQRTFVGREKEIEQFQKLLLEPKGQAILVVGQEGMGKTWLVNKLCEIAENHQELKCGWVRCEVTPTDSVDSVMARMMDNAFDAAQVEEGSFDGTEKRLEQWRAFLNVFNIGDLVMSLRRDPVKNTREQFLERLRLISERMPEEGRSIFIVDPEKYMQKDSDQSWAIVVRDLPDKIKFVFAQRPEDVLSSSDIFGTESNENIVRVPREGLEKLSEKEVDELLNDNMNEINCSVKDLRKVLKRYDGHPYAVGAAIELVKAGTKLKELPKKGEPILFATQQWEKVKEVSAEAIKLFEAYSVLEVAVSDDIVEAVSNLKSFERKNLIANKYLKGLMREESGGRRIYHIILSEHIKNQINQNEKNNYIKKAIDVILTKEDKHFFEKVSFLDFITKNYISLEIAKKISDIFSKNEELCCYFYEQNQFSGYPDARWVRYLDKAGEFEKLGTKEQRISNSLLRKAKYLTLISNEKPEEVLNILKRLKPENESIKNYFIDAILNMPDEFIIEGFEIVKALIKERKKYIWYWTGEPAAQLMVKLLDIDEEKSFALARLLLDIWEPTGKKDIFENITSRFGKDEYGDILNKYYVKLIEKYPYKAIELMIGILDGYLEEEKKKSKRDRSEDYYIYIEGLDDESERGYKPEEIILIESLRDSIKIITEKEPEKIEDIRESLESRKKAIFTRLEMYLLKYANGEKYKGRINEILSKRKYFERMGYAKEYNNLLCKQKDIVTGHVKEQILKWIEQIKIDKDFNDRFKQQYDRDAMEDDIKKFESRWRAQRLYPIKELFPKEYDKYSKLSGATERELQPKPIVSEGFSVSGDEGTPLTNEQMNEMSVEEVLEYLANPKNYNYKPKEYQHHSPKGALAYTFQKNVKERVTEYLKVDPLRLLVLDADFLSKYFYGFGDSLREKKTKSFDWDKFFEIANEIVKKYSITTENIRIFRTLVDVINTCFGKEYKIEYTEKRLDGIYEIIRPLFDVKEVKEEHDEQDPVQLRCNSTTGESLMTVLSLGIVCKRDFNEKYESEFKNRIIEIFEKVLNEIKTSWTICTFGSDFARIYWLIPDWVEDNLCKILSVENWKTVWGAYLHWSRPSVELFKFLRNKGIYDKAIERKGEIKSYGGEKSNKRLAQHIVIAYFNGWLNSYDDELLQKFIKNSSDELMGYTAYFFTTGFESLQKEPNQETNKRIQTYWERRLEEVSKNKNRHQDEISALANWIDKCPLERKKALDMEEQTLKLCHAKFGRDRDYYRTIKALCSYYDTDKRKVIKCIRMTIKANKTNTYFGFFKKELTDLLEGIEKDEDADENLIKETITLIDELGRLRIYEYRQLYESLRKRI